MRQYFFILTASLVLTACSNRTENNSAPPSDVRCGISILNSPPRGGGYTASTGKNFGFRVFRTHVINDTIIPIELTINFPSDSVVLTPTDSFASLHPPKSDRHVRVFLFPRSMTPDKQEEVYNYGIKGLDSFLDTGLNNPTMLKITIQPKQDYILYIGALLYPAFGRARTKLFIHGRDRNKLDLAYRILIDPPLDSVLIPCGHIVFQK